MDEKSAPNGRVDRASSIEHPVSSGWAGGIE
jgi:hypothetical protein